MHRFLHLWDEVDEYVGLLRHLAVGVAADCSQAACQMAESGLTALTSLRGRLRGLN